MIKMVIEDEETVELLCMVKIEELNIYYGVVASLADLLFARAAESRLAGRLQVLSVEIRMPGWKVEEIDMMPFKRLKHMRLRVFRWETQGMIHEVFGEGIDYRIDTVLITRPLVEKWRELSVVERLGELVELKIANYRQQGGVARAVAEGKKLKKLMVYMSGAGTGITVEDSEAIVAAESLQEVIIVETRISLEALEVLVKNQEFVDRLERLGIDVRVELKPGETLAGLGEIGLVDKSGRFMMDTGSISIVID